MNLFVDDSKVRRRSSIEGIVAKAGSNCRNEGPLVAESRLRGQWQMRCRDGDLRVSITLAPTEPATVQFFDVAPMKRDETIGAAPVCRNAS